MSKKNIPSPQRETKTKPKKRFPFIMLAIGLLLVTTSVNGLAALGSPQKVKHALALNYIQVRQIQNTTKAIFAVGAVKRLEVYDVFATDFGTNLTPDNSITFPVDIEDMVAHPSDGDVVFVAADLFYVGKLSTNSIEKTFTGPTQNLKALAFVEGGNYVWAGGMDSKVFKYDYTATSGFTPEVTSSLPPVPVLSLNLMDPESGPEMAWGFNNDKVYFVTRTGNMDVSAKTREYTHVRTDIENLLRITSLPAKIAIFSSQTAKNQVALIDYSNTAVTRTYDKSVCNTNSGVRSGTHIKGSIFGIISCNGGNLKEFNFETGTKFLGIGGAEGKNGVVYMVDRRFIVSVGDADAGGGIIKLWGVEAEKGCHTSCGACEWDATITGCTSCPNGKVLRTEGSCGDSCPDGEYLASAGVCAKCHASCLTCSGGAAAEDCQTCPADKWKRTDSTCGASCRSNEYPASGGNTCSGCDPTCLTCSGGSSTNCQSCSPSKFLRTDSTCGDSCNTNEYQVQGTNTCSSCHSDCSSCSGPSNKECSSCSPTSYTYLSGSECLPCTLSTCPDCPKGSLCDKCLEDPTIDGCPEVLIYSLGLKLDGVEDSGEISYYLK